MLRVLGRGRRVGGHRQSHCTSILDFLLHCWDKSYHENEHCGKALVADLHFAKGTEERRPTFHPMVVIPENPGSVLLPRRLQVR
jgi:hypothetical protein